MASFILSMRMSLAERESEMFTRLFAVSSESALVALQFGIPERTPVAEVSWSW